MLSVREAAEQLDVSPIRVRQLLSTGALSGRKTGKIWLVEQGSVARRQILGGAARRMMGPRMLRALLDSLDLIGHESTVQLNTASLASPSEALRLRTYLRRLWVDPHPAQLLREWVGTHERLRPLRYLGDPMDLLDDPRVSPTGFSHRLSTLVSRAEVDVRCPEGNVDDFVAGHLLIEDNDPNVYLHYSKLDRPDTGFGTLLVDLAAHGGGREDQEVQRLLNTVTGH